MRAEPPRPKSGGHEIHLMNFMLQVRFNRMIPSNIPLNAQYYGITAKIRNQMGEEARKRQKIAFSYLLDGAIFLLNRRWRSRNSRPGDRRTKGLQRWAM